MPYYGYFQPYGTWIAMIFLTCVVTCYGYTVFLPGRFTAEDFLTFYLMVLVAPFLFFGWKLYKRTKFIPAAECDLVWHKGLIDAYEASYEDERTTFWQEIGMMFGFRRHKKGSKA